MAATESEAVVEDSLLEASRQSNGRCQFSQYTGSNPVVLSVLRSSLRIAERTSSSGRTLGFKSSATILNAVAGTKLNNNRARGDGYSPRVRLLQDGEARLSRRVHTAKSAGSNPAPATKIGGSHAATWEKPRGAEYALSQQHQILCSSGAHGGLVGTQVTRARSGAGTPALMRNARNESTVWRSLVARRGSANYAEVAGSNPVTVPMRGVTQLETCHGSELENVIDAGSNPAASPHPTQLSKRVLSAQPNETATRLASIALSVMGSAAARPDSIRGAA